MLKFASFILGENYQILQRCSNNAQQKIRLIFLLLLLPIIIYFFAGFGIAYKLCDAGFKYSLFAGLIAASIAAIIDFSFLKASGSAGIGKYRFCIAMISSILTSILCDSVMFHDDYKEYAKEIQIEEAKANFDKKMEKQNLAWLRSDSLANEAASKAQKAYIAYDNERNGLGPSGELGYGDLANRKEAEYHKFQMVADSLSKVSQEYQNMLQSADESFNAKMNTEKPGLLTNIRALVACAFQAKNWPMAVVWILVFCAVLLLEYSPLFIKSRNDKTDYDRWKEQEEWKNLQILENERLRLERLYERQKQYSALDVEVLGQLKRA